MTSPSRYATGYIPPVKGEHQKEWEIERLFKTRATAGEPVGYANNLDLIPDILDQGALGSCTLHGWAQQIRADAIADDPGCIPDLISILYAYYNTRLLADPDSLGEDTGADPHVVGKAINKFGAPKASRWPYDVKKFARRPPDRAYSSAYKNRSPWEWYWISRADSDAINKVKIALDARCLVGIGTGIDGRYEEWQPDDDPLEPPVGSPIGLHYTVMAGYDADGIYDVGSWGVNIADCGVWKRSFNYINYKYTTAMLVITKAPVI